MDSNYDSSHEQTMQSGVLGLQRWIADETEMSEEMRESEWNYIKQQSDLIVQRFIYTAGKPFFAALGIIGLGIGFCTGYHHSRPKHVREQPIPVDALRLALKALGGGTALCLGVSGLLSYSLIRCMDIHSVSEFHLRMRQALAFLSPESSTQRSLQSVSQIMEPSISIEDELIDFKAQPPEDSIL